MSLIKNKNIVFELTRKQIKTQYRDSTLGFVWTFLNPLLNMLVMWVVFQSFFGVGDPFYSLYLLTGNIVFAALRASTTQSLNAMVMNRGLLLRTKISFSVFPFSYTLASIVNFFFSLIALVPFMIWLSIQQHVNLFSYQIFYMFLMIPALLLFEYGVGLFLSVIFVFFRDLKHLYSVFLTLWQYLTPIFYTVSRIDKNSFAFIAIQVNPMYHFVNYFRDCMYRGATGIDIWGNNIGAFNPVWGTLGILYACAAVSLLVGYGLYRLLKRKIIVKI